MSFARFPLCLFLCAGALGASVRAGHAQIAVVSSTIEERSAVPGDRYAGSILLRNTSSQPQEAKVYLTDYAFFASGRSTYSVAGSTTRSNASWIRLQATHVLIPPHGETSVTYWIDVPQKQGMNGTYWSMVMVEATKQGSAESSRPALPVRAEVGLQRTIRYGIQVVTHMSEPGARTVDVTGAAVMQQADGAKALQFDVTNTGARAYRPKLTTELYDDQGKLSARFESARGLIYPGSSVQQVYALPTLRSGNYKVMIIADTGADQLYAAQYRLSF